MWCMTRKILEDRPADSLKKRVHYNFTDKHPHPTGRDGVFYIHVDKKTWFATNPKFFDPQWTVLYKMMEGLSSKDYWDAYKNEDIANREAVRKTGWVEVDPAMRYVHEYLNVYGIDDCLSKENYFLYLLAIMDKRAGKRRVKKILAGVDEEPQWIRRFILLRGEAEGLMPSGLGRPQCE